MPPTLISREGGSVPFTYTLSADEQLNPQSIVAMFDGTGAGATFLPCCSFYAQDGTLIGRFPADQSLAVGDEAIVSFAPFLRGLGGGGGPPAPGSGVNWCFQGPAAAKNCPLSSLTPLSGSATGFYTNAPTVFAQASTVIGGGTYYGVNFLSNGHVIVWATLYANPVPDGTNYELEPFNANDGDESGFAFAPSKRIAQVGESVLPGAQQIQTLSWTQLETVGDFGGLPLGAFILGVRNEGTGGAFTASVGVTVIQLDTDNTFID